MPRMQPMSPSMSPFQAGFPLPFEELRQELDRLWTSLSAAPPLHDWGVRPEAAFPAVNVCESDEAIIVEAELPGLEAANVGISVAGDELVLEGARPEAAGEPATSRRGSVGLTGGSCGPGPRSPAATPVIVDPALCPFTNDIDPREEQPMSMTTTVQPAVQPAAPAASDSEANLTYQPNVDIRDTGGELIFDADIPGVRADGIDVTFEDGVLCVRVPRLAAVRPRKVEVHAS